MNKPDPKMLKVFLYYIGERKLIHDKKERGDPWPWTTDEILQDWSFTNVYRAWDRTTKHFVDNFYKPNDNAPAEQISLNCAAFRYFGTTHYADRIGWLEEFDPDQLLADVNAAIASGVQVFTGAYVITNNGIKKPKEEVVICDVLTDYNSHLPSIVAACQSGRKERVHNVLSRVTGFGGTGFMAKEVIEDMCLTRLLRNAKDADTYTPMGPGARRGLARLYGDAPEHSMLARVAYLRDQIQQHCCLAMTAHDVQFNLCEAYKYLRMRAGEGKPRSRYKPPQPVKAKGGFFAI